MKIKIALLLGTLMLGAPSMAMADEFRLFATADQLQRFTTEARTKCKGDICHTGSVLTAFTAVAKREGLLGTASDADYANLLKQRYTLFAQPTVAVSDVERLALSGLVLPDARVLSSTAGLPLPAQPAPTPTPPPMAAPVATVTQDQAAAIARIEKRIGELERRPAETLSDGERKQLDGLTAVLEKIQKAQAAAEVAQAEAARHAELSAGSATAAAGSATAASTSADTAKNEANRAEREADRSRGSANDAKKLVDDAKKVIASLSTVWWWIIGLVVGVSLLAILIGFMVWQGGKMFASLDGDITTVKDDIDTLKKNAVTTKKQLENVADQAGVEDDVTISDVTQAELNTLAVGKELEVPLFVNGKEWYKVCFKRIGTRQYILVNPHQVADYAEYTPVANPLAFLRRAHNRGAISK